MSISYSNSLSTIRYPKWEETLYPYNHYFFFQVDKDFKKSWFQINAERKFKLVDGHGTGKQNQTTPTQNLQHSLANNNSSVHFKTNTYTIIMHYP